MFWALKTPEYLVELLELSTIDFHSEGIEGNSFKISRTRRAFSFIYVDKVKVKIRK